MFQSLIVAINDFYSLVRPSTVSSPLSSMFAECILSISTLCGGRTKDKFYIQE
jgi:hypothetical protein